MTQGVTGPADSRVGQRFDVEVGPVAHGGHFVARVSTGVDDREMVTFVRHALPGEQVTVEITEDSGRFLRGDAVQVAAPSPHRVPAPCPLAHPGGCGGCDFQHVELSEQRRLKAHVVSEQLSRLAGIERDVVVEPVPGDRDGLFWRTRMQYVHLPGGDRGLRKHRSHEVVVVDRCLIAHPEARESGDPSPVVEVVETALHGTHEFAVAGDGFWQAHPGAPRALVDTVMSMLSPQPGERALDLYSGGGLFSAFLAEAVGIGGKVTAIESDRRAAVLAGENLTGHAQVSVIRDRVDRALSRRGRLNDRETVEVVVLDPPRAGAKRQVVRAIADLHPRAVAYVACDPASLARDIGYFAELGYRLSGLRAFDLFPMTHHVECVALLVPE
ncbi:MAG TPA: TRAM domain-containing protein [Nocardioidaceae bacterium]|nr:TRAM domain-containing protein [Nocardioidaceae bacterium]